MPYVRMYHDAPFCHMEEVILHSLDSLVLAILYVKIREKYDARQALSLLGLTDMNRKPTDRWSIS